MKQQLLSLSGPLTPPAIPESRLQDLTDYEAGLVFVANLANKYKGLTWGQIYEGMEQVKMGDPCGAFYTWDCIKSFSSDMASGTKKVLDYTADKAGDAWRLLWDEDVTCGLSRILESGGEFSGAAAGAFVGMGGTKMAGCEGEGTSALDSLLSLLGFAAKQEGQQTKQAGFFGGNTMVVVGGVLIGGLIIGALIRGK